MRTFGRATSMSRKRLILRGVVTLFVLVALGEFYSLSFGRSIRLAGVVSAHNALRGAYKDYTRGAPIEQNGSLKPFLITNTVVVNGKPLYCIVAVPVPRFENEGVLAMTSNEILVWIDNVRPPKIISGPDYKTPLFSKTF